MREIVFDTETTGLDPHDGHRVVEIGCVEIVNLIPTGQTFHVYINPDRDMPEEAFRVHGLSADFLRTHPRFAEVVDGLLAFVGDEARLVAHNAGFDFAFLNAELKRAGRPLLMQERIVDTLSLARRRHPGASNRLDDLCLRYRIDNSRRTKHGALLDAELLAEVYAELCGGRQASLGLLLDGQAIVVAGAAAARVRPAPLPPRVTEAELAAHAAFLATFGAPPLWQDFAG
ncbi:MAG TPA: DNA polymerase III subunit epsilon [Hyphomicrobiales bacterium]|nr:DNA polymerase III subunit epsilon [Hyphomicrobiales bacterium]